jgi:hypothetical protein
MYLVLAATALLPAALAKDKGPLVPLYILQARTVTVMIDPHAPLSLSDPNANQTARKDVESALSTWGRLQTVLNPNDADIVIVLRKGTGKLADPTTVNDPRQNPRPGSNTNGDISVGVQHGRPPTQQGQHGDLSGEPPAAQTETYPRAETGTRDDAFVVYRGHTDEPTNSDPSWMYVRKNALHSHDVPAVDEFRKAVLAAEKQAAQQKP